MTNQEEGSTLMADEATSTRLTPRQIRRQRLRYLAVLHGLHRPETMSGYVLDFYPEEEVRYRRQLAKERATVLGPFDDSEAAAAAIHTELRRRLHDLRYSR